jgi:hypothetical protein
VPLPSFVSDPLHAVLAREGFERVRRRELYTRAFPDGLAAIEFVRDKWSRPPTQAGFTAHLGFQSTLLAMVFGTDGLKHVGPEWTHWYRWIGNPDGDGDGDYPTWHVDVEDPASVAFVVKEVERRGIPALAARTSNRALADEWLKSDDPFLHRTIQAAFLAVLLRSQGASDRLAEIESKVRYVADQGSTDAQAAVRYLDGAITL